VQEREGGREGEEGREKESGKEDEEREGKKGGRGWVAGDGGGGKGWEKGRLAIPILVCFRRRCVYNEIQR